MLNKLFLCLIFFIGFGIGAPLYSQEIPFWERKIAETVPDFVIEAVKKAPQDALVGIGTAKLANMSMSRTTARVRARAGIAKQINEVVVEMVRKFSVASVTDPNVVFLFQERITVTTSRADLQATSIIDEGPDNDGNFWVVIMLNKEPVSDIISQARAQTVNDFPQMSSFNAAAMLNDALISIAKDEIVAVFR
ncbi:MAG: hypothetical protein FWC03_08525 [Treponema sp.]|nr:hypothetical protein [Treponema sp.]